MSFANCSVCGCSVRYKVHSSSDEAWARALAKAIGAGERAEVLCVGCWLSPSVGDPAELLEAEFPPGDGKRRQVVVVREVINPDSYYRRFRVEGRTSCGEPWEYEFMRRSLRVLTDLKGKTLDLRLVTLPTS